jgi:hypothetical protein
MIVVAATRYNFMPFSLASFLAHKRGGDLPRNG